MAKIQCVIGTGKIGGDAAHSVLFSMRLLAFDPALAAVLELREASIRQPRSLNRRLFCTVR